MIVATQNVMQVALSIPFLWQPSKKNRDKNDGKFITGFCRVFDNIFVNNSPRYGKKLLQKYFLAK